MSTAGGEAVALAQDKAAEIRFFSDHAAADEYDVFTPESTANLVDTCLRLTGLPAGSRMLDLGCGSGTFTSYLAARGMQAAGLELSWALLAVGRAKHPGVPFSAADIERLPVASESVDGLIFSGVLHHLPDVSQAAHEAFRVLKPGGSFVAFDPNRLNPFMWLYRDRSSPLYSPVGVTENERPVLATELRRVFAAAGFSVRTVYQSGLRYRYLASRKLRWALPVYNAVDSVLFKPRLLQPFSAFVLTVGRKVAAPV